MSIVTTELARRLCVRNHPFLTTTGAQVPCGEHTMGAQRFWYLASPAGTHSFEVIRDARDEFLDKTEPTIEDYRQALIWMTGSDDFSPGGKAREGFEKIVEPLLRPVPA